MRNFAARVAAFVLPLVLVLVGCQGGAADVDAGADGARRGFLGPGPGAGGGGGGAKNLAANNTVTKSNGTNLVASSITDPGTVVSTSEPLTINTAGATDVGLTVTGTSGGGAGAQDYLLSGRGGALVFPVPYFRPVQTTSVLALDLFPHGAPTIGPGGFTWIDACDADLPANGSVATHCARLSMGNSAALDSVSLNGASQLSTVLKVGGTAVLTAASNLVSIAQPTQVSVASGVTAFGVIENQNSGSQTVLTNTDPGSAAFARIEATNDSSTGVTDLYAFGTGWTTAGALKQDSSVLYAGAGMSNGMNIVAAGGSAGISLYTGGSATGNLRCTIDSTGAGTWSALQTFNGGITSTSANANTFGQIKGVVQSDSTSTGTLDNFVINASTSIFRWSAGSNAVFDGFKCGAADCAAGDDGRILVIVNAGVFNMTLKDSAAGSAASNQILSVGGTQIILGGGANSTTWLVYDGTSTKWRVVSLPATTDQRTPMAFNAATAVTGLLTLGGGLTLTTGNVLLSSTTGHIKTTGTAPTPSSCGTSPAITGTDIAGRITTGSATTTCTITFAATYTNAPSCWLKPEGTATMPVYTVSATAITVTTAIASTVYDYGCTGLI